MKKFYKAVLAVWGLLMIPAMINEIIAKLLERRPAVWYNGKYYRWRHGYVHYRVKGKGAPLLLVHGITPGESAAEWDMAAKKLSGSFRVYAIDLLGYGRSDKPRTSYSAYLQITLINDFIKDVIGEPVYLAAASGGADYAVMAYSFCPENFKKLVLVSPVGIGWECYPRWQDLWKLWLIETPIIGKFMYNMLTSRRVIKRYLKKDCFWHSRLVNNELVEKFYFAAHKGRSEGFFCSAKYFSKYLNVDLTGRFRDIKIPAMIVWGQQNRENPIERFSYIEEENDNIGLAVFEYGRIMPHAEYPGSFAGICLRFFEGNE